MGARPAVDGKSCRVAVTYVQAIPAADTRLQKLGNLKSGKRSLLNEKRGWRIRRSRETGRNLNFE